MSNDKQATKKEETEIFKLASRLHGQTLIEAFEKNSQAMKRMQWRVDCALSEISRTKKSRERDMALSDLANLKVEMSDILGNRFYLNE